MSTSELQNLEKNIQRLKEQLAGKRDTLTTIAPEEKVRIGQQLEDLRLEIRELEREKWGASQISKNKVSLPEIVS